MQSYPQEILREAPEACRYKYVERDDVLLMVDPTNLTVIFEIHQ